MSFDQKIYQFKREKNWKNIIKLAKELNLDEQHKYLWAWPTEDNLNSFKIIFNKLNIENILSIGCGTGLLEWLIMESTGIPVYGIERDRNWWMSKYSPKYFINLNFIDDIDCITPEFLQNCCLNSKNFTLCFCYFNCKTAFIEYLSNFNGNTLIVIGPGHKKNVHTEPLPYDLGLTDNIDLNKQWLLSEYCEIGDTYDFIAIYVRNLENKFDLIKLQN